MGFWELFVPEEFPKLHDTLSFSTRRGRRAHRGSWTRNCQSEDEDQQPRARSFPRAECTVEVSTDPEVNVEVCGSARAYSTDRGLDALHTQSTTEGTTMFESNTAAKGILKKRSSFGSNTAENDDTNANGEIAMAAEELKASVERMASILRKSQAHSDVDVESQLAAQLSQVLGKMGQDEDGNNNASSSTSADKLNEPIAMVKSETQELRAAAPPGAASWEFPLSRNEKEARVIMLSTMENESLKEELGMRSRCPHL